MAKASLYHNQESLDMKDIGEMIFQTEKVKSITRMDHILKDNSRMVWSMGTIADMFGRTENNTLGLSEMGTLMGTAKWKWIQERVITRDNFQGIWESMLEKWLLKQESMKDNSKMG